MSARSPAAALQDLQDVLARVERDLKGTIAVPLRLEEDHYDAPTPWRLMGARVKARNVADLCARNGIAPRRLIEVGAGDGAILGCLDARKFCPEMHALEVSGSGVDVIERSRIPSLARVSRFDGYSIPYDDGAFDVAVLSHVLEHVEHERVLLREIQRVSRFQVIEVPLDWSQTVDDAWAHLTSYGHINVYPPPLLRFLLKTERFHILDDLPGSYDLEVMEYLHFVHQGHARTPEAVDRFRTDFSRRQVAFDALPAAEKERVASAYTVLTRRMTDAELVEEHVSAARKLQLADRPGDARLVLQGLARHALATTPRLPPWAEALLVSAGDR